MGLTFVKVSLTLQHKYNRDLWRAKKLGWLDIDGEKDNEDEDDQEPEEGVDGDARGSNVGLRLTARRERENSQSVADIATPNWRCSA